MTTQRFTVSGELTVSTLAASPDQYFLELLSTFSVLSSLLPTSFFTFQN